MLLDCGVCVGRPMAAAGSTAAGGALCRLRRSCCSAALVLNVWSGSGAAQKQQQISFVNAGTTWHGIHIHSQYMPCVQKITHIWSG